jgi:hypothetical protein
MTPTLHRLGHQYCLKQPYQRHPRRLHRRRLKLPLHHRRYLDRLAKLRRPMSLNPRHRLNRRCQLPNTPRRRHLLQ